MRDTWSTGLYFCVYHNLKRSGLVLLQDEEGGVCATPTVELLAGGLAGVCAWGACLPADVVKTRIQSSEHLSKKSWLGTLNQIVREGGVKRLFTGAVPLLSRAFFVNAVTFYVYEECNRHLK